MSEKEYIGSQQHWEDSINDDYDERERMQREQSKEYDKQYLQQPQQENEWIPSAYNLPPIGSNVEISDDGITVRETADYIESRTCMLAGAGGGNGYFGRGFATDGSTGCDKGLILDTPAYWRF